MPPFFYANKIRSVIVKGVVQFFCFCFAVGNTLFAGAANPLRSDVASVIEDELVGSNRYSYSLRPAKLYLIYFSAHWCPPCRTFTPVFADFYNSNRRNDNFEVVFVSKDSDERSMFTYMRQMPWPAVKFEGAAHRALTNAYAENGIPHLVAVKPDGEVLFSSYVGTNYVGPAYVLDKVKEYLAELSKNNTQGAGKPVRLKRQSNEIVNAVKKYSAYTFNGTFVINNRRGVIINDRRLYKGDRIFGAYVVDIQEKNVTLSENGRKIMLSLK